jgi:hypothetical protein
MKASSIGDEAERQQRIDTRVDKLTDKLFKQTILTATNDTTSCSSRVSKSKLFKNYFETFCKTRRLLIEESHSIRIRKPDTNILALELNQLVESSTQTHAGDPTYCVRCKAVLSKGSHLIEIKNSLKKVETLFVFHLKLIEKFQTSRI